MILFTVEQHDAIFMRSLQAAFQVILLNPAQGYSDGILLMAMLFVSEIGKAC
ncbi:hypothetical protein D3C74_318890 [compost metagenome]